ncbi:hypothetical protein ACSU1N_05180 [Thermogladius sp. 4427co]|uniref:hypothetical protein n=1 Tax=Thermogladius sp. 4427co TaxID=3450718 RepID=UPI003F7AF828
MLNKVNARAVITTPLAMSENEETVIASLSSISRDLYEHGVKVIVVVDDTIERVWKCIVVSCSLNLERYNLFDLCKLVGAIDELNRISSSIKVLREAILRGDEASRQVYLEYTRRMDELTAIVSRYWESDSVLVDSVLRLLNGPMHRSNECNELFIQAFKRSYGFIDNFNVVMLSSSSWIRLGEGDYGKMVMELVRRIEEEFGEIVVVGDESKTPLIHALGLQEKSVICS